MSEFGDSEKEQLLESAGWATASQERRHQLAIALIVEVEMYPGSEPIVDGTEFGSDVPVFHAPATRPLQNGAFLVQFWNRYKNNPSKKSKDCYEFDSTGFKGYHRCDAVWGR